MLVLGLACIAWFPVSRHWAGYLRLTWPCEGAWVESQRGHEGYAGERGYEEYGTGGDFYGYGPPTSGCHPAPQPCGGYGYYGYGYAYPIIIETTVHTGAAATTYEVIEEVVEYERPRRRYRQRSAPPPRARPRPRPRPPAGERG